MGLVLAGLGAACGGRTSSVNMSEERTTSPLKATTSMRMTLIGCVKPGATKADGSYVLDHVILPAGEIEPQESSRGMNDVVPRGSWVRLGGPDMHQYLGKQVLVSGDLDAQAAGTAGHVGTERSGDYVKWSTTPRDVPLLAVETVKVQAEACKAD